MKFKPGSIWQTKSGILIEVAYEEDGLVHIFYYSDRNEINPRTVPYIKDSPSVANWIPYIEGSIIYKSRFQMILDKTNV